MLDQVSKDFLARIPVTKLDWKRIEGYLDDWLKSNQSDADEGFLQWQNEILNATVLHPLCLQYPPPKNYIHVFLKTLINKIEKHNCEIHHQILEMYANLLDGTYREDSGYRTYLIDRTLSISLKENVNIISEGTTGLYTWQAAFYLAEWAIAHSESLAGKRVIELGSGSGLVGLLLWKTCRLQSLTFTDFHPKVLATLRHNVDINLRDESNDLPVAVRELDWLAFSQQNVDDPQLQADLIIASDVVYDADLIPALTATIRNLLVAGRHGTDGKPSAIVACTVRNEETGQFFLNEIGRNGLAYSVLPRAPPLFSCDRSYPVRIYQIQCIS